MSSDLCCGGVAKVKVPHDDLLLTCGVEGKLAAVWEAIRRPVALPRMHSVLKLSRPRGHG